MRGWTLSIITILHECKRERVERIRMLHQIMKLIMPNAAHVNISAAGVAKSAKNKKEHAEFIEFISSPKGSDYCRTNIRISTEKSWYSKGLKALTRTMFRSVHRRNQKTAIKVMADAGWR